MRNNGVPLSGFRSTVVKKRIANTIGSNRHCLYVRAGT